MMMIMMISMIMATVHRCTGDDDDSDGSDFFLMFCRIIEFDAPS